jgi:hypothetical protein
MVSSGEVESERVWAEQVSRRLLEPRGARWRHTQGVVERVREAGRVLADGEADVLIAAAYLHDVGYAPELRETAFHPLDGARFLRKCGRERLAGLVAYHCGAEEEARERGLHGELVEFVDERSWLSRTLTYCDLTTDPEGRRVVPSERLAEIRERYGPEAPETRALARSTPALLHDVRMIELKLHQGRAMLAASGVGRRL